jgi:hypothetical protein
LAHPAPEEHVMDIDGPTQGMPVVGETVPIAGFLWRCVAVAYLEGKETNGPPEIRVRYRRMEEGA